MATPAEETNPISLAVRQSQAGRVAAPTVPGSVEAIDASISALISDATAAANAATTAATDIEAAGEEVSTAIIDRGQAEAQIKLAEDVGELVKQQSTLRLHEATGGVDAGVARLTEQRKKQEQLNLAVDAKADVMDDQFTHVPLIDQIINEFRALDETQDIITAQSQLERTNEEIAQTAAAFSVEAQSVSTAKQTMTAGAVQAGQSVIRDTATIEAKRQEIANLGTNAAAMAAQTNASSDVLNAHLAAQSAENTRLGLTIRQEELTQNRARFQQYLKEAPLNMRALEANVASTEEALAVARATNPSKIPAMIAANDEAVRALGSANVSRVATIEQIQAGQMVMGYAAPESAEVIEANYRAGGIVGARYEAFYNSGSIELGNTIGLDPANSMQNLRLVYPDGGFPDTPAVRTILEIDRLVQDGYVNPESPYHIPGGVPSNPEQVAADFNRAANMYLASIHTVKKDDKSNPRHMPPLEALVLTSNAVKNSVAYQKVLEPVQASMNDATSVTELVRDAMLAGTLTPEEAAEGIYAVMTAAGSYNSTQAGGLGRVGLGSQVDYPVILDAPSAIASGTNAPGGFTEQVALTTPKPARFNLMSLQEVGLYLAKWSSAPKSSVQSAAAGEDE